jgi:hypothetical protein
MIEFASALFPSTQSRGIFSYSGSVKYLGFVFSKSFPQIKADEWMDWSIIA